MGVTTSSNSAATYQFLASQTLGSNQATVTFSGISGSYTDLVLIMNVKGSTANFPQLRFNSDTGSNYSRTVLTGDGSTPSSSKDSNVTAAYINYNAYTSSSEFNYNSISHILNYSNTTTYKTQLHRANNAASGTDVVVTLWRNTNAITSIDCIMNSGNYAIGSTLTLYGIKAA